MSQYSPSDQVIHMMVGLMEPQPCQLLTSQPKAFQMIIDQFRHHGANLAEHAPALLHEQLVAGEWIAIGNTVEEAGIIANGIGKARHQTRAKDFETGFGDRKSTRLNSSHVRSSYAVFCLKKKK